MRLVSRDRQPTVTRFTVSFIERNIAFIPDTAGTASITVNIMEEQLEGGGNVEENRRKRSKLSFFILTVLVNNQGV